MSATGRQTIIHEKKEMLKAGFVMNLISILLIVLATYFLVPLAMRMAN